MKKLLLVLCILTGVLSRAQYITVDATTYSAQQLIENILINSPCVSNVMVTNAVSGNFGDTMKSYGYFNATGTSFPFESGIVMSTGRLNNVPGPNTTLSDDNATNWGGDADLNAILNINNTLNATVLEFDFVPSASGIRFNYIFASEEYQENNSNTCVYSDVFAFLIKPVEGTYTNIAVVPNTNTPVKVTTVHPNIPGGCAAINEDYFGSFNGSSSPINFNGQTAVLTAEANVIPNQTYHIKLIIADEQNYRYDSAVFLEAESFNTSANLGADRTIQNGNPLCTGDTLLLSPTIADAVLNYNWFKDNVELAGETTDQYLVTTPGTYRVEAALAGGCMATDDIIIEYAAPTSVNNVTLSQCDDNENGLTVFNLTVAEQEMLGNDQTLEVTGYYTSYNNAVSGTNSLNNPGAFYNTVPNQIVYVRVANQYGCVSIAEITLTSISNQIPNAHLSACDSEEDADGYAQFNLTDALSQITNGLPANINVAFFETETDAYLNQNSLPSNYTNTSSNSQTLYTRVYNQTGCYGIGKLYLSVYKPPVLPDDEELIYCENLYPGTIALYSGAAGNISNYSFLWSTGETTSRIHINQAGNYSVTVTNNRGCSATRNFTVTASSTATLSYEISGNFGDNSVTLSAIGSGEYLFALDSYSFQQNNTFYHLASGRHVAYAEDSNGCGIASVVFYIIDFPKYFTPNNDGVNDFWQVLGEDPQNTQIKYIYIYDRYGKLLDTITPSTTGWDGTYHGKLLPSDDYWFKAIFLNGQIFNSNFSLIR